MSRISISEQSTEYIRATVHALESGVRVDPTGGTVSMAFLTVGDDDGGPVADDWLDASWETSGGTYYARILVGPDGGSLTLSPGTYRLWVKMSVGAETPVKAVGNVYVY